MIKRLLYIAIITSSMLLSGCWDRRPVDKLGIISNITIEKLDDERIKLNIVRPTFEIDKKELTHNTTVEANSISEALNELQKKGSKTYVLGQVNTLLIGKDIAADGIEDLLFQLDHITDFKKQALLSILDSTIEDLKKFEGPQQERIGILILDTIESSVKRQQIPETKFHQIMNIYSLEGKEIVLPSISIDSNDNNVVVQSLVVFKGDKMVGKIDITESIPYMIISSPQVNELLINIPSEYTIEYGLDKLSVIIRDSKAKIKTKIEEGIPVIHVDIELLVDEHSYITKDALDTEFNNVSMDNENIIKYTENAISNYLENATLQLIKKTQQEFESDIFGFGEKVRVQNNQYFKSINWKEEYPKAQITCSYTVNLRKLGTVK